MSKTSEENSQQLPLVSVCIPLYNAVEYIEETIVRLLQQTYENIEIIVVDDHSTDGSREIVEAFKAQNLHIYTNNKKGGNAARNFAFRKAKGDYIKFMDADDYCSDSMIENQIDCLLSNGANSSLVFSPLYMLYKDGKILEPERTIDKNFVPGIELVIEIWRGKGFNCPHCHLMHRELVEKSGGWDESIIKNQDGEFFARVANSADKVYSVPYEFAMWRQTEKGVSANISLKAHASVIETFGIITKMILSYNRNQEHQAICGKKIGLYVFNHFAEIKALLPRINEILSENRCSLILPNRKVLKILSKVFGWKFALSCIHKFNLK